MHYWYGACRALKEKTLLPNLACNVGLFGAERLCVCVCAVHIDFTAGEVIYQNYSRMLDTVCINNKAAQLSFN